MEDLATVFHVAMGIALFGFALADLRDTRTQCICLFVIAAVGAVAMAVLQ